MEKYIESFDAYTSDFDMNDKLILSRYHHSYRVMELSKHLSESLKWEKKDIDLAMIIGLLHDYGRFEQIRQYHTIDDKKTVDHAEYGIRYLFDENKIEEFVTDTTLYPIIRKSIYYHNKYALPNRGLTRCERKHMKLIRDADKLDILYLIGVLKDFELHITDDAIGTSVSMFFSQRRTVPYESIRTDNEKVIAWLAYIFDLNYRESFRYLKTIHLLDIFFENLGRPDILKPYFDYMSQYIDEHCKL